MRRTLLAMAVGLAGSGAVMAQSTTGTIFGTAPAGSDETVHIQSTSSGLVRDVPIDRSGRFNVRALPIGTYTVSLQQGGKTVDSRSNVRLQVGASTQVSFAAAAPAVAASNAQNLGAVQVRGNALPAIDVTSVDSRNVVTAEQLSRLPISRSAEAVALLAPGAGSGSAAFGGVAFSGSSVAENAYYINGFNTSSPLRNLGGSQLPYGAIEQQETITGGYGPQYGRSDGGVISQVGKRGSNQWHAGAQIQWIPRAAKAGTANTYYAKGRFAGQLYDYNNQDSSWDEIVSAYFGGPLIKDKLFIFGAYEFERAEGSSVGNIDGPYKSQSRTDDPRWYAKLDWNITDSNILEFTGTSDESSSSGSSYNYDYDTDKEGSFRNDTAPTKSTSRVYIGKYTGYLTDDLTVSALYGEMHQQAYAAYPGYDPSLNPVSGLSSQNPAIVGNHPVAGKQVLNALTSPGRGNRTRGLRLDVSYHVGDHTLSAGVDNLDTYTIDQGILPAGPGGFTWAYGHSTKPDAPINADLGVPAPSGYPGGEEGYYVSKSRFSTLATVHTAQRAQYVEDAWNLSDRLLVKLGLRNDQFTNYNSDGEPYIAQTKPQWAPRLGFAWDVNGDASFKVFGNVGRYYLALPNQVAVHVASGSLSTSEYYTYTGIDPATGYPTGLTSLPPHRQVSSDNEFGKAPDPATVAAKGIRPEYQDEYILGFQKQLTPQWVYGVKATVRNLRNAIDDVCDSDAILAAAAAQGVDTSKIPPLKCLLFNPGRANDFVLLGDDGSHSRVHISNADFGFPHLKRKYAGLDFSLEHPFDGTWYGAFNYTWSHSYGDTEGPVLSANSEMAVSATVDWDTPELMVYSNGDQGNDRRHQFKFNGYYQLSDEWLVGGNVAIASGLPKSCRGSYAPDDRFGSGGYHFCNGEPQPPGRAGRLPWQFTLSSNLEYRPRWADKKLAFNLYAFNLLNQQRPTLLNYAYNSTTDVPADAYDRVIYRQAPRYVRLAASYDF